MLEGRAGGRIFERTPGGHRARLGRGHDLGAPDPLRLPVAPAPRSRRRDRRGDPVRRPRRRHDARRDRPRRVGAPRRRGARPGATATTAAGRRCSPTSPNEPLGETADRLAETGERGREPGAAGARRARPARRPSTPATPRAPMRRTPGRSARPGRGRWPGRPTGTYRNHRSGRTSPGCCRAHPVRTLVVMELAPETPIARVVPPDPGHHARRSPGTRRRPHARPWRARAASGGGTRGRISRGRGWDRPVPRGRPDRGRSRSIWSGPQDPRDQGGFEVLAGPGRDERAELVVAGVRVDPLRPGAASSASPSNAQAGCVGKEMPDGRAAVGPRARRARGGRAPTAIRTVIAVSELRHGCPAERVRGRHASRDPVRIRRSRRRRARRRTGRRGGSDGVEGSRACVRCYRDDSGGGPGRPGWVGRTDGPTCVRGHHGDDGHPAVCPRSRRPSLALALLVLVRCSRRRPRSPRSEFPAGFEGYHTYARGGRRGRRRRGRPPRHRRAVLHRPELSRPTAVGGEGLRQRRGRRERARGPLRRRHRTPTSTWASR